MQTQTTDVGAVALVFRGVEALAYNTLCDQDAQIRTQSECSRAVRAIGLPGLQEPSLVNFTSRPPGCSLRTQTNDTHDDAWLCVAQEYGKLGEP